MSAAWEPEHDPVEATAPPLVDAAPRALTPTAQAVGTLVGRLPAVDLSGLDSALALLTRVDRKYVVPLETFDRLVDALDGDWQALEIDGSRLFGYTSTYFDTDRLDAYRAHVQGRRRRYKVRVRRYTDSELCMLEVKRKGLRGMTVKTRTPHPAWASDELGAGGQTFVRETLGDHAPLPRAPLGAVVRTRNRRATLASAAGRARLTVDTDLVCGWGEAALALRPGFVLLESKVEGSGGAQVDRALRRLGERPVLISKYCVGVASLGLDVPDNPWRRMIRRFFEIPTP